MLSKDAKRIVESFAALCNTAAPRYEVVNKAGQDYLAIHVGGINDVYTAAVERLKADFERTSPFGERLFLRETTPAAWLLSQETQILQRLISESLTVGRSTLDSDFHEKFIPFLGGEEGRIYSKANHVVFGRRGAGKSSLVLYACHQARKAGFPFCWIAIQQYRRRSDLQVVPQILAEIVEALRGEPGAEPVRVESLMRIVRGLEERRENLTKTEIAQVLPLFAREFLPFVKKRGQYYLFIDDLHLLHPNLQPFFLSSLYSFSRGNNVHLKITAIENLTRLQNEGEQEGLQTPGDAQIIRLDYNLVDPGRAHEHITEIITSYVKYVGIPSPQALCGKGVAERLTWVSAGVPRDALYIFSNAITKAIAGKRKRIGLVDVNMSAADSLTEKEQHVSEDVGEDASSVLRAVDDIKAFCLREIKSNAFLVHLKSANKLYQIIKKASDLRFIHVLHPGITPEKAGEKYEAFMLDYAFYTGFRKAPSVRELRPTPTTTSAKELRKLQRYPYETRLTLGPAMPEQGGVGLG
jgi:hypothetical protein